LVSARRGEGKTTLLVSLLKSIEQQEYKNRIKNGHEKCKCASLYSLGLIDPTLIEAKQNIVIAVVERIRKAIYFRRNDCHMSSLNEDFDKAVNAMRRLAMGLKLLDGVGSSLHGASEWDDADFIMDVGLEDASGAYYLERHLITFIENSASYLGVDAFVLAIDDADTLFERGWPVLEALRKYLVTPKLRIIMSGDINLYTELVRRKQWEQIGKDFLDAEDRLAKAREVRSRVDVLGRIVEELQDQYLVKLLPPENRIDLDSLLVVAQKHEIELTWKNFEKPCKLHYFLEILASRMFGFRTRKSVNLVCQVLLGLPTRSVVQILSAAKVVIENERPTEDMWQIVIDTYLHVTTSALITLNLSMQSLRTPNESLILIKFYGWLTSFSYWKKYSQCYPNDIYDDYGNQVSLLLGALLFRVFRKTPSSMLGYCMQIALLRDWIVRLGNSGKDVNDVIKSLYQYLEVKAQESSMNLVSRFSAFDVRNYPNSGGIRLSGVHIPYKSINYEVSFNTLYGQGYNISKKNVGTLDREAFDDPQKTADPEKLFDMLKIPFPMRKWHRECLRNKWVYKRRSTIVALGYFVNTIHNVVNLMDPVSKTVALIPLQLINSSQDFTIGVYSFLRLIGAVENIMSLLNCEQNIDIPGSIREILNAAVSSGRNDRYSDGFVGGEKASRTETGTVRIEKVPLDESSRALNVLINALSFWLEYQGQIWKDCDYAVPPFFLSKMWTRFSVAFDRVRDNLRPNKTRYLGILFHRMIIVFLHAFGVEEVMSREIFMRSSLQSNPTQSGELFLRFLKIFYDDSGKIIIGDKNNRAYFFDLIFSCPIWGYFLDHSVDFSLGTGSSKQCNNDIFKIYKRVVSKCYDDKDFDINNLWRVKIEEPHSNGKHTAEFDGLHDVLNTIYIQSAKDWQPDLDDNLDNS
jgi:hypothetical protein